MTFIIAAKEEGWAENKICDVTTMVGDVNLFFKGSPEDENYEVEVEIMIAGSFIFVSFARALKLDTQRRSTGDEVWHPKL